MLRVSAIGYENYMHPFRVSNNTNLGTLRINPGVTSLGEVTVAAERPLYAMEGEKLLIPINMKDGSLICIFKVTASKQSQICSMRRTLPKSRELKHGTPFL